LALNRGNGGALAMPGDGVRIETEIDIDRRPEVVFDYVSTPALWSTWHPATVAVLGAPERPLTEGETALELIAVAGRREQALWTVTVCTAPQRWEIITDTDNGSAHIVYRIIPVASGCRFQRALEYRSKRWPWRALDSTLTRWILERQSTRALRQLKALLER
jgi:hypothetical protein